MASFDPTSHVATAAITITNTSNDLVSLSGGGITQAQLDSADMLQITPQADCYYLPGTTVTTSLYHILSANKTYTFSGVSIIRALRFLRAGGSNVIATVSLYKVNRDNVHF